MPIIGNNTNGNNAVAASGSACVTHNTTIKLAIAAMFATLSEGKMGRYCRVKNKTAAITKPERCRVFIMNVEIPIGV